SATYRLKSTAWIKYGQPKDYLNLTLIPSTNTTVFHNETYVVKLPVDYEMVSNTILPSPSAIATVGYTDITIYPGLTGQAIRMVLERSLVGIARAKVTGPSGKFYVVNSTYQHYQAYVANNMNITFSAAETSNPPSNDSTRDNFTWRFLGNVSVPNPPNNVRYGITPTFAFPQAGPYIANLTAIGSGGNVTYRNIDIWVDGVAPTANFKTNVTGTGSAVGANLHVNEGTVIRFDGGLSTDLAYPGKTGVILNSGYAWDFHGGNITDATGRVVNWTFSKPGKFLVNLTLTDSVGNKGANVSLTITVNDTQPPVPGFTILDPTNDYAPVSTLVEMRNYTFNASKTTDDYDKVSAINFTWTIPGPLIGDTRTTRQMWGENITFGWSQWNLSYPVKLVARDTGFGSGKPNNGTLTQNVSVQIDHALHPYLTIVQSSVKIDNANPQSGQTVTITLNVTNTAGWGTASHVTVRVSESSGTSSTDLSPTWSMADKNGTALSSIAPGGTAVFKVSVSVIGQGNKTLTITVSDQNMPYTLKGNTATVSIIVQQPAWVNYAIIGSVVAVFAVVIFAMYYRRKVKAGDWQPRFRRAKGGKDEGGKERPRKEREAKEEKKRL
ncbi:MAG TPA: PKD domain-containing protein, partial [Thermoplasmata archaeon]|nr:PKD domain-containing protein [Thermoplasmata archaeon]